MLPTIDLFALVKFLWGGVSCIALACLKIVYSRYKKTEERVDSLEKDVIRMKAEMVTKERFDEIMDNKLKSLKEDVAYLRKEVKEDIGDLRSDLNRHFQLLVEQRNKK